MMNKVIKDLQKIPEQTIDFINRQQSALSAFKIENARLVKENAILNAKLKTLTIESEYLKSDLTFANAEIEKLEKEVKVLTQNNIAAKYPHSWLLDTGWFLSKEPDGYERWNAYVRNEAYKEVFQKLNDKALVRKIKIFGNWFIVKGVTLHDINALKKEMIGE